MKKLAYCCKGKRTTRLWNPIGLGVTEVFRICFCFVGEEPELSCTRVHVETPLILVFSCDATHRIPKALHMVELGAQIEQKMMKWKISKQFMNVYVCL